MRRLLMVALLLLAGCGGGSSGGPATPAETQDAAPSVKTLRIAEGSAEEGAEIDLAYPGLVLPGKSEVEGKVNAEVKQAVDIFMQEFREAASEPVGLDTGTTSMLEGDFETTMLDERTASFRLTVSQFIAGAAHPGATTRTFNFDLNSGELLELADLFQPQSEYLQLLSDHCRKVVEAVWLKEGPVDAASTEWINEGTRPVDENFAAWSLSRNGLEIVFNEYQVGPYAMGPVQCDVPRETVARTLKTAGSGPGAGSTISPPPLPAATTTPTSGRQPLSPTPKAPAVPASPAPPPPPPATAAPPPAPPPVPGSTRSLGYPFAIQVGETVAIDGEALTITYERLLEDSRCPADVHCIWAGNARILVTVIVAGQSPAGIEINTNLEPRAGSYSGYTVMLVDLGPGGQPAATLTIGRG